MTSKAGHTAGRCFACDKPIKHDNGYLAGCADEQDVGVGGDCYAKIRAAGETGYQPPKGGPRLYVLEIAYQMRRDRRAAIAKAEGGAA